MSTPEEVENVAADSSAADSSAAVESPAVEPAPAVDATAEPAIAEHAVPPSSRRRRVGIGLLFLLSCLFVVVTSMVVWTHQVLLNTDRFVSVAGAVSSNPAVIDTLSKRVSQQVVTALDVEGKIKAVLPGPAQIVAVPLTARVQQTLEEKLAEGLSTDRFQQAWERALRLAHTAVIGLLRGQSDVVGIQDGVVTLNAYALVGDALGVLQSSGIIPADVTLPDLSNIEVPEQGRQRVEQALGITLPADFGQIPIVKAQTLETARQMVQLFDIITILLIVVTLVLGALTIWLARRRLRMTIYLAIGVVVSLLVARALLGALTDAIVSSLASEGLSVTLRAVLDEVLGNFYALGRVLVIVGIIVAVVAYLAGRPRWAVSAASAASGAVRSGAGGAAAAGTAAAAAAAGRAPTRESATGWIASHQSGVRLAILAAVAFAIVWWVAGFEIAVIAAAVVLIGEAVLRYASAGAGGGDDDEAALSSSPVVSAPHHEQ